MFDKIRAGIAVVALLGCTVTTAAEARDLRPYVSPQVRLIAADDDRNTDDAYGAEVSVGLAVNEKWGTEIGLFYEDFSGPQDWTVYGYRLNNMLFLPATNLIQSYGSIGFGLARTEPEGAGFTSNEAFADIGLGFFLKKPEGPDVGLRLDSRYRHTFAEDDLYNGNDFGEMVVSLGLVFPVGRKTETAPALPAPGGVTDSDGDGVGDRYDRCPGTPSGVPVDAVGCPLDSDGDGVPDDLDRSPRTPAGVAVDEFGVPLESSGQTEPVERRFEDVNFAFDSSAISEYASVLLDNTAAEIRSLQEKYKEVTVQITGHTDSVGTKEYNSGLSTRRANAVRDYLVRKGVNPDSIVTLGFGETQPVASNKTPQGRLLNRRGEIRARGK
ncbi:OmpA family protein [Abyssibacter sp.]|jgi:OOP family OmpA-OmpF porin|uniref:OmpA family protein n=1 Tax=Abyssibacter sp. TaxID=2320200 RepID=UPI000C46ABBD|nr:OmpA family protein [Abyssibacter sp.]MBB86395.1 hypothetical protein [Xanthomonadales bacterium]MCK5858691.1 OmpA family protein [Abyssibacter sp.]